MKNLYEILEISPNSTVQEIKKAYKKLLRKYPPEKEAEKYKEIREAYDTLKDPERRKNYDAYFKYGDKILILEKEANSLLEKKEYSQAENLLKKILILAPETLHIKTLLGLVFCEETKYSEALKIFNELIEKYPKNSDYYFKRGQIYEKVNNFNQAKIDYLKAFALDYENPNIISSLVYLCFQEKKIDSAISFLEKIIYRDHSLDFEDFFCLSKLIECYVLKNDRIGLQKIINMIKKITPNDIEAKEYMAWKLTKLASSIANIELYILAYDVIYLAYSLTPKNQDIINYANSLYLYMLTEQLMEDKTINYTPLKGTVVGYMFGEKIKKDDRKKNLDVIFNDLKNGTLGLLYDIQYSLTNFKEKYNRLYLEQRELYDSLLKEVICQKELRNFIEDTYVENAFKHCLLALEINDSQELKKGLKNLSYLSLNKLRNTLAQFDKYPNLKNRHYNFISELEKSIKI